jgi:hypothetical protein
MATANLVVNSVVKTGIPSEGKVNLSLSAILLRLRKKATEGFVAISEGEWS